MQRTKWFERAFPVITDNGLLPTILERLAGTPARTEEIVRNVKIEILSLKPGGKWSIKEEIGHLGDLEPLWLMRLNDLVMGNAELTVADLTNRRTHEANHNSTEINTLLRDFRDQRRDFVLALRNLEESDLQKTALHPRLKTPMRVIDLAYFVAEHDDHHLANSRDIIMSENNF